MFGMDDLFAFEGADIVYVCMVVVLDVVLIYLARKFFKKV
jgi:hypothetical protein